jgi:hypothetical protein
MSVIVLRVANKATILTANAKCYHAECRHAERRYTESHGVQNSKMGSKCPKIVYIFFAIILIILSTSLERHTSLNKQTH